MICAALSLLGGMIEHLIVQLGQRPLIAIAHEILFPNQLLSLQPCYPVPFVS
jgi:hypothetical protein